MLLLGMLPRYMSLMASETNLAMASLDLTLSVCYYACNIPLVSGYCCPLQRNYNKK